MTSILYSDVIIVAVTSMSYVTSLCRNWLINCFRDWTWTGLSLIPEMEGLSTKVKEKKQIKERQKTTVKNRNDGKWQIFVTTGQHPDAGTDNTPYLIVYGEAGSSKPIPLLDKKQRFTPGSTCQFQVWLFLNPFLHLSIAFCVQTDLKDVGRIFKVRVRLDSQGPNPMWYLKKVRYSFWFPNEPDIIHESSRNFRWRWKNYPPVTNCGSLLKCGWKKTTKILKLQSSYQPSGRMYRLYLVRKKMPEWSISRFDLLLMFSIIIPSYVAYRYPIRERYRFWRINYHIRWERWYGQKIFEIRRRYSISVLFQTRKCNASWLI